MRILIVSQYFHPESFRINPLARALKEGGHEVVVLTAQPNYPEGKFHSGHSFFGPTSELHHGIEVVRVPIIPRGRGRSWELILNYLSFVFFAIVFGLPRVRGKFDVCLAFCSSPITIAIPAIVQKWLRGTPVAIWVQDLWPETFEAVTKTRNRFVLGLLGGLVRFIYRAVDQIWIQSEAYRDSVIRHGAVASQVVYVPNWAEDFYDRDSSSRVDPEELPRPCLLFAGNLGRAQGLERLLDAAELHERKRKASGSGVRPLHWVFIGDGSLRREMMDSTEKRGLSELVHFLPRRPAIEVPAALQSADALLVTLGGDRVFAQTVPSKVQSCLAAGKPILGMLAGEPAKVLVESGAAMIAPPNDVEQFVSIIQNFERLTDQERRRMGDAGHDFYKRYFTQAQVISQIEGLLREMHETCHSRRGRDART